MLNFVIEGIIAGFQRHFQGIIRAYLKIRSKWFPIGYLRKITPQFTKSLNIS